MPTPQAPTSQDRFLSLIKRDILKCDAAELDFGIDRILNYRRDQVLAYLDTTLPGRIAEWAGALAQTGGRVLANSPLQDREARLVWDVRRVWERLHQQPPWQGIDVVLFGSRSRCGVLSSAQTQAEIDRIQPGFRSDKAPSVLLQQEAQGDYVDSLLTRLAKLLPAAA